MKFKKISISLFNNIVYELRIITRSNIVNDFTYKLYLFQLYLFITIYIILLYIFIYYSKYILISIYLNNFYIYHNFLSILIKYSK